MKRSGLTIQSLSACCILLVSQTALAAAFGEIQINSYLGKTLDVRIALSGAVAEGAVPLFRQASAEEYQRRNLEYTDLHSRLLIDPVLSEKPPYIAVSSIGAVNRKSFELLMENLSSEQPTFKRYEITLAPPPNIVPLPKKKRIISASEVLWQLLTALGHERGLTRAQLMTELLYLQSERSSRAGDRHVIFSLEESAVTQEFIDGLTALMIDQERQAFAEAMKQGRSAAVLQVLIGADNRALLGRLLDAGIARNAVAGGDGSEVDARAQIKSLQNKLIAMESMRQSKERTQKQGQKQTAPVPENAMVSNLRDWVLSRDAWIVMTAVWLLLLAAWVLLRFLRR